MFHKITKVTPKEQYTLYVAYEDGSSWCVDLHQDIKKWWIFKPLQDMNVFRTVKVWKDGRSIYWDENIDLCPDAIYEEITWSSPFVSPSKTHATD